ncbi:hypothetical protein ILYODFUR_037299 [Ilyodon furcidens]|uniref:Uncharacterized protein n=1 Tax=Ilyodon furcidens TaxID=33524 RepID=A0ABV0T3L4_9TELE
MNLPLAVEVLQQYLHFIHSCSPAAVWTLLVLTSIQGKLRNTSTIHFNQPLKFTYQSLITTSTNKNTQKSRTETVEFVGAIRVEDIEMSLINSKSEVVCGQSVSGFGMGRGS